MVRGRCYVRCANATRFGASRPRTAAKMGLERHTEPFRGKLLAGRLAGAVLDVRVAVNEGLASL